jgi:hypothetical protein
MLELRRHLLVQHQHDIFDDEVRPVPDLFLPMALRNVGVVQGSVPMTASQRRRHQRREQARYGASGTPEARVRLVQAVTGPSAAASIADFSDPPFTESGWNLDGSRSVDGESEWMATAPLEFPELAPESCHSDVGVEMERVPSVDAATQSEPRGRSTFSVGVQACPVPRHCLLSAEVVRELAELVVAYPAEGFTALLGRLSDTHGPLMASELEQATMVLSGCLATAGRLATYVCDRALAGMEDENNSAVRMYSLWTELSEYARRANS